MFEIFKKKKIIVTHNGGYHADDVFACAALSLLERDNVKIIRTRDPKIIEKGDYVADVGGVYDPSIKRFDHHQKGGAGSRENGIQYASIGLVWKHYGEVLCGSKKISQDIDRRLIQSIDAPDNGQTIFQMTTDSFMYQIADMISSFAPTWDENDRMEEAFIKSVSLAKTILSNEIRRGKASLLAQETIKSDYNKSPDKRLVIVGRPVGRFEVNLAGIDLPELLFAVFPDTEEKNWKVTCMRKSMGSFDYRKKFPAGWAGLRDKELAEATGVPDAIFCHRDLFLAVSKSKEGAIRLAELALNAKT